MWATVDVKAVLKALDKAGVALNPAGIKVNQRQKAEEVLYKFFGVSVDPNTFVVGVRNRYERSWRNALIANGFDPEKHNVGETARVAGATFVRWKEVNFQEIFAAFHAAAIPLNFNSIKRINSDAAERILRQILKVDVSAVNFVNQVTAKYGSYDEGLRQSGFDPSIVRVNFSAELSKEKVILALKELYKLNVPLNSRDFIRASAVTKEVFTRLLGAPISNKTFIIFAANEFGGWPQALKAADLPVDELVQFQRIPWSKSLIVSAVKALSLKYSNMNIHVLALDSVELRKYLFEKTGYLLSLRAITRNAQKEFGSWAGALEAAKINRKNIWTVTKDVPWSADLVTDILAHLARNRVNMRIAKFLANGQRIRNLTYDQYHVPLTASAIYHAALNFFGGWREALDQAGVELKVRAAQGRRTDDLAIIPHVVEWEKQSDGSSRRVVQMGQPPATPEDLAIRAEDEENVASAIDSLTAQQKEMGKLLLAYLQENDDLEDKANVVRFIESSMGSTVSWGEIEQVLQNIAEALEAA